MLNKKVSFVLLDTNRPDLLHIRHPLQHLLNTVLLQGTHTVIQRGGEHLGDAGVLLEDS